MLVTSKKIQSSVRSVASSPLQKTVDDEWHGEADRSHGHVPLSVPRHDLWSDGGGRAVDDGTGRAKLGRLGGGRVINHRPLSKRGRCGGNAGKPENQGQCP